MLGLRHSAGHGARGRATTNPPLIHAVGRRRLPKLARVVVPAVREACTDSRRDSTSGFRRADLRNLCVRWMFQRSRRDSKARRKRGDQGAIRLWQFNDASEAARHLPRLRDRTRQRGPLHCHPARLGRQPRTRTRGSRSTHAPQADLGVVVQPSRLILQRFDPRRATWRSALRDASRWRSASSAAVCAKSFSSLSRCFSTRRASFSLTGTMRSSFSPG